MSNSTTLLGDLDLEGTIKLVKENRYRYEHPLGFIDFVFPKDKKSFFDLHNEIWSENKTEFFLTNFDDGSIHICDSKTKPDVNKPIEKALIDSFNYGENTPKSKEYLRLFKKENIDTGECIEKIHQELHKRRTIRKPVDKDLLENLKELKRKITTLLDNRNDKEEIAQKIIDRCLFIRSIEDRTGRNELKKILSREKQEKAVSSLLSLFDFYSDALNGDIFDKSDIPEDINKKIIKELNYIFGEEYTYRTRQRTLFPYNFKKIPTILISNIYEEFLAEEKRRSKGMVFTPLNVVEYIVDNLLQNNHIAEKAEKGEIRILDPACGSSVFLVKFFDAIVELQEKRKGSKLSFIGHRLSPPWVH